MVTGQQEKETLEVDQLVIPLEVVDREEFGVVSIAVILEPDPTPEQVTTAEEAEENFIRSIFEARASDVIRQLAHDMKTPLTSLLTKIYVMRRRADSLPDSKEREVLYGDLNTLELILKQLADQINNFKVGDLFSARFERVSLSKIADEILLSMDKNQSVDEKVNFSLRLPPPGIELWTDKRILTSIISNILSNAFAYTHQGEVALDISVVGQKLVIKVRDTGKGIPEEKLPTIFQKGVSLSETDRRPDAPKSTGFGMYIVRQYVEELGGRIEVASEVGKGTEFTVSLPLGVESPVSDQAGKN